LLDISRSSFYYCPKEAFDDSKIINLISEINQRFPYYGYRKIHWHLTTIELILINRKKVQRLMKISGIKAIFPGPRTSIAGREAIVFP
jgi:putative transposase